MDAYEATKEVFSRIQKLDPENASKIMGLLLIQDHSEKEMIRLAFGPENLIHSLVVKARANLGISHNIPTSLTIPTWGTSVFSDFKSHTSLTNGGGGGGGKNLSFKSGLNPSSPPFYGGAGGRGAEAVDEIQLHLQTKSSDFDFWNKSKSELLGDTSVGDSMLFNGVANAGNWGGGLPHRRSCSTSHINLNGLGCRFVHGGGLSEAEPGSFVGSPSKVEMMEQYHQRELLRSKSMQHKKLMDYSMSKGLSLFAKHNQNVSPRAVALMMEEDLHKFNRSARGIDNCGVDLHHASRQIYLTFPADSTFREEDVSSYFSIYGPVEDVRIPYQQKRMFGFVTFVFPETVKIILAKGNPHFVCDSRVLVKPYKEKGKVPDKFRKNHMQMERGDFPSCDSPTFDSRDPFDIPPRARMMYDRQTQYMLWKRKVEEQDDLEQALELQSRRLMGLQLLDVKQNNHHRSFSSGAPSIYSPTQSPNSIFHQALLGSDRSSPDASDEIGESPPHDEAKQALEQALNEVTDRENEGSVGGEDTSITCGKDSPCQDNIFNLPERFSPGHDAIGT